MQASVPQFIDVEDRLVGPLTLKQLGYYFGAGLLAFICWLFFDFSLFLFMTIVIFLAATVFAFFKINDRPFIYFVLAILGFYARSPLRVWNRRGSNLKAEHIVAVSFTEEIIDQTQRQDIVKAHLKRGKIAQIEKALETA